MKGIAGQYPHYPPGVEAAAIKTDFGWVADNRARIVAEWTRRYDGKAAKEELTA